MAQQIINSVVAISLMGKKMGLEVGKLGVDDIVRDGQVYKGFNQFDELVGEVVLPNYSMHWVGVKEVAE